MTKTRYMAVLNGEVIGECTTSRHIQFATCVLTVNGTKAVAAWHGTREAAESARIRALRAGVTWFLVPAVTVTHTWSKLSKDPID